jgi:tetratricopeptide (TPR) repeat protein
VDRQVASAEPVRVARGQSGDEPGHEGRLRAEVDVLRFRRLCRDGGAALRDKAWDRADRLLGEALSLWRGAPLADIPSRQLLQEEVPGLEELWLQATEWQIDAMLQLGRHDELIPGLQSLTCEHALRERFHSQLMLALYRCGRQAEALAAYRHARDTLVGELGTEPGPGLRELHQRILSADPALALVGAPSSGGRSAQKAVPRELPATVRHFTGRADELAALTTMLDQSGEQAPEAVVISAIGGTAGVGKTALAVQWAHQAAGRFPGGQLYVNLRGYDLAQPMTPADALAAFLRSLGVASQDIPAEEAERAVRYRSLLAGRRMLVVLDNAGSAEQVRPLLPGDPACVVVVTSRDALTGLVARDGARRLDLDLLPPDDAVGLLRALIGSRVDADPAAAAVLASQCSRLPLALRVAAELAAARPAVPLTELADELADRQRRLDRLDAGADPRAAVRAVFSWSYRHLTADASRAFRLLGLHPGPDITIPAAASLAGLPVQAARLLVGQLTRMHLLTQSVPGRFAFHDLLRVYSAERAAAEENRADRDSAVRRVLDHYLHTAYAGDRLLAPARDPLCLGRPGSGVAPEQLASYREALAWFEAEYRVLLAAVELARTAQLDVYSVQIPWVMVSFFDLKGHWHDAVTVHRYALAAARRTADRAAKARTHRSLSAALIHLDAEDYAYQHLQSALCLYVQLGDRIGQARVNLDLARVVDRLGCHRSPGHAEQSLRYAEHALALLQAAGHRAGQARALNSVGWYRAQLGDYELALGRCSQAARLCHESSDLIGEAAAWDSLGFIHRHLGAYPDAITCYRHAVDLTGQLGGRYHQADALTHLGDTQQDAGDLLKARDAWRQALAILDELGHPDTHRVRTRLKGLERN